MTLRDHFAGLAMQGLLTNRGTDMLMEDASSYSYRLADMMLNMREHV